MEKSYEPDRRTGVLRPAEEGMKGFRNFLLDNLPEESREKLLENVSFTTIPANRYIFQEGEPADYICIIQKGQVKLSHIDPEGREAIAMILSENDTIWESLFLYEETFPYSAVTMTESRICRIYRENFLHILDNREAALEVIALLSRKLHDANIRNQILMTQDPTARLAGFLIYHMHRESSEVLNYRLEDIGGSINLRMETISRKLSQLQEDGLVLREGRGRIRILDSAALLEVFRGVHRNVTE